MGDDIAAGRLVAPFPDIRLKVERGYDLVYRAGNRDHPKVCALRGWLAVEVRDFLQTRDEGLLSTLNVNLSVDRLLDGFQTSDS